MLVRDHREDELFEVPPVVFVVTVHDSDGSEVLIVVIFAKDTESRRIRVEEVCPKLPFCHKLGDDFIEEVGGSVFVDSVQSPNYDVIVEMFRSDSGPEELFCGNVVKETGDEIHASFIEPQPVDDHGFDNVRMVECMVAGFRRCLIDNSHNPKIVNCTGSESQVPDLPSSNVF